MLILLRRHSTALVAPLVTLTSNYGNRIGYWNSFPSHYFEIGLNRGDL